MIRFSIGLVLFFLGGLARAQSPCDAIQGEKIHSQLAIKTGVVCFLRQPVKDKAGAPVGVDEATLFFAKTGAEAMKSEGRGLLYDEDPGDIVDAFVISSDGEGLERIVVIQSIQIRSSLSEGNSSGKFYSVSVFDQTGETLRRNERASYWFGDGYSWIKERGRNIYEFPYKTRKSVMDSIGSPFYELLQRDVAIQVEIVKKINLYEGPQVQDRTKKYLVAGDRAVVDRVTAGWCQLNYSGVGMPIKMWTFCDALKPKK